MRAFLETWLDKYYDYTPIFILGIGSSREKCSICCNERVKDVLNTLSVDPRNILAKGNPAKGSSVYVVPKCDLAVDDIRHTYTIKKYADTADYNVFSSIGYSDYSGIIKSYKTLVIPDKKTVIINNDYEKKDFSASDLIQQVYPNEVLSYKEIDCDSRKGKTNYLKIFLFRVSPLYADLLAGKLKKPCVHHSKLTINDMQPVTLDLLELVYQTGKKQTHWGANDVEPFRIQLHALNQHNWRACRGTVALLLHKLLRSRVYNVSDALRSNSKLQSKGIQQLYSLSSTEPFRNVEDFNLAKQLVSKILGINGTMFASYDNLYEKLRDNGLDLHDFNKLYTLTIRIQDKEYKNVKSSD